MNDQYSKIKLFRKCKNYLNELTENFKFNEGRYPTNIELSEILNFYTGSSFFTTNLINESVADNTINSFARRLVVLCEDANDDIINFVKESERLYPDSEISPYIRRRYEEALANKQKGPTPQPINRADPVSPSEAQANANQQNAIKASIEKAALPLEPVNPETAGAAASSKNKIDSIRKDREPKTTPINSTELKSERLDKGVNNLYKLIGGHYISSLSAGPLSYVMPTTAANTTADVLGNIAINSRDPIKNVIKGGIGGAAGSLVAQGLGVTDPSIRQASSYAGNLAANALISDKNAQKLSDLATKTNVGKYLKPLAPVFNTISRYIKPLAVGAAILTLPQTAKAGYEDYKNKGAAAASTSTSRDLLKFIDPVGGISKLANYSSDLANEEELDRQEKLKKSQAREEHDERMDFTGPPTREDTEKEVNYQQSIQDELSQRTQDRLVELKKARERQQQIQAEREKSIPRPSEYRFSGAGGGRTRVMEQRVVIAKPPRPTPTEIPKETLPGEPIKVQNKATNPGVRVQQPYEQTTDKLSRYFPFFLTPEEVAIETQREEAARLAKIRAENPLAPEVQPAPVQKNYTREFFPYLFPDTDQSFTRILPATEPPVEDPKETPKKDPKETPEKDPKETPEKDPKETPEKDPKQQAKGKPATKNPKKIDTKEDVVKKDPKTKDPTRITPIPIPPPGRFGGGSFRDSKSFVSEPETNPQDAPGERWWALVAPGSEAAIKQIQESHSGKLNTKSAIQSRVKKQQYKITVTENSKKLEIFASSIRGIRRAVYGKKNYRVFDSKGSDITNYFKRLMATKKST